MSEDNWTDEDTAAVLAVGRHLGEVARRGAPKLGETVRRGSTNYVCSSIHADGCVVLTPIPEGMTSMDLGRNFPAARLERY